MSELETFLNDEPVETPETPPEPIAEETPPAEPPTDETPAETPPEPEEGSPAEPKEEGKIPIAALLDEREKRQERDRRIAELEAKLSEANKTPPPKAPDVLEDQEGFTKHFEDRLAQARREDRIEISQDLMRTMHEDYDEMEIKFAELAQKNPALVTQLNQSQLPAKFAYDTAKAAIEAEKLSDPAYLSQKEAEMEARIRKKIEAENAENAAKAEAEAKLEATLTPSLANQRGGATAGTVPEVADPLETTFNR